MARLLVLFAVLAVGLLFGFVFLNSYWARKQLNRSRLTRSKLSKWFKRADPAPVTEKDVTHLLVLWWTVLSGMIGAFSSTLLVRGIQPFRILIAASVCAAFGGWLTHHLRAGFVEKKSQKEN